MNSLSTSKIMQIVILSTIPAIAASIYCFGEGVLFNILYSVTFCILLESIILKFRNKNIINSILDFSAVLTAVLFAICLPPDFSIYKIFLGCFFAIIIAKHLYGGLGHNIFNPAMVGYLVLLVSFPQDFTNWTIANYVNLEHINLLADDISQATPLDPIFNKNNNMLYNFYFINSLWLISGLYLIYKKIVPIALPLGFLLGIFTPAAINAIFYTSTYNPLQNLFLGATMIAAFYIITDPVTASVTKSGRWIYSLLAGIICYLIREFGGYPDGVGFAIIFMNTWVPLINKLTVSKAYLKV